jgi:hypothetical protein
MSHRRNLDRVELTGHYGCVNAINFSNKGGQFIVSGGDDRRVLVWRTEEAVCGLSHPITLKTEHASNIFSTVFDNSNEHVYSAGNDEVVLRHNVERLVAVDIFPHRQPVYGVSVDPDHDGIIVSAGDNGLVFLWDSRMPESPCKCVAQSTRPFHAAVFHPTEPRFIATANAGDGVGLWDIRQPHQCLMKYGGYLSKQKAMSVVFDCSGNHLLALRRRLPVVLYDIKKALPVCQFTHEGYMNSCTMKSASFCGDNDQYVASGSDNFNVYVWKIPDAVYHDPLPGNWVSEAHCVLVGHRSIVNQVRFNRHSMYLISSGVEKVIKMWSPFAISGENALCTLNRQIRGDEESARQRQHFTQREQHRIVLGLSSPPDVDPYAQKSTAEDAGMLAFFDSLLQQEELSDGLSGSSLQDEDSDSDNNDIDAVFTVGDSQNGNEARYQFSVEDILLSFFSSEFASSSSSHSSSSSQSSSFADLNNDEETESLFAPSSPSSNSIEPLYSYSPIRASDISEEDSSSNSSRRGRLDEHDEINGIDVVSDSPCQHCVSVCDHQTVAADEQSQDEVTSEMTTCSGHSLTSLNNHVGHSEHDSKNAELR